MKQIYLKNGKEESLQRFHPWVFSGAIHHFSEQPDEGEVVAVYASLPRADHSGFDHKYIATGHYQVGSIMVRVLSFTHEDIDEAFYQKRLQSAYDMRRTAGLARQDEDTNSYRLVHGERDICQDSLWTSIENCSDAAHSVGMHEDRMT